MIIALILNFIVSFIAMLFSIIPTVTIADIPIIGPTVYGLIVTAMGYWNSFVAILPYFGLPWTMFVKIIIPFELTLLLLKVFLGHRTPAHFN
jgi:cellulose synthase/poly-beta-1,6-N-acetylglucosamine synthase-like glycosyltransferase